MQQALVPGGRRHWCPTCERAPGGWAIFTPNWTTQGKIHASPGPVAKARDALSTDPSGGLGNKNSNIILLWYTSVYGACTGEGTERRIEISQSEHPNLNGPEGNCGKELPPAVLEKVSKIINLEQNVIDFLCFYNFWHDPAECFCDLVSGRDPPLWETLP